jgi:hypothetical protein
MLYFLKQQFYRWFGCLLCGYYDYELVLEEHDDDELIINKIDSNSDYVSESSSDSGYDSW